MGLFLLVDAAGLAVNAIEYDGSAPFDLAPGLHLVPVDGVQPAPGIGWMVTADGSDWTFTAPPQPDPGPGRALLDPIDQTFADEAWAGIA